MLYFLGTSVDRNDFRTFRLDRVEVLVDLETGEVAADAGAWLRRKTMSQRRQASAT